MSRSRGNYIWRCPGNANIFDSDLKDWYNSFLSQRSIGCLQFIKNNNNNCEKRYFENNIKTYLYEKFNHQINKSNEYSFYSPLIFLGLINKIKNGIGQIILSLSIDGIKFLEEIKNKNYLEAKKFLILQMLKTKYPNSGTDGIKLKLFPFRIIFKLLLEKKGIDKKYFSYNIPYIQSINDINNIDNINEIKYNKWNEWGFTLVN